MLDFTDKVVMVTGASGNLGSSVIRKFWEANATVVLVDRVLDRLIADFPESVNHKKAYLAAPTDVTSKEEVNRITQETINRFGRIDILVNTVGGYRAGDPVHETTLETWEFMLNLNARTVLVTSQSVVPYMITQASGKIISISSRAGLSGNKNSGVYSVAKSAVIRLTESMSSELKSHGINVNCILPGTIDTPQNREAMPNADTKRWVSPESLADVIMFLASDLARDVHGVSLPVFGLG